MAVLCYFFMSLEFSVAPDSQLHVKHLKATLHASSVCTKSTLDVGDLVPDIAQHRQYGILIGELRGRKHISICQGLPTVFALHSVNKAFLASCEHQWNGWSRYVAMTRQQGFVDAFDPQAESMSGSVTILSHDSYKVIVNLRHISRQIHSGKLPAKVSLKAAATSVPTDAGAKGACEARTDEEDTKKHNSLPSMATGAKLPKM